GGYQGVRQPEFRDRPGESAATPPQQGGGGRGGFGGFSDEDQAVLQAFESAGLELPRRRGGFGGRGGGQGQLVEDGSYTVTLTVDGRTLSRELRVEDRTGSR
ncbi:MAG: hypothetical protein WEB88_01080, partial [Gemmatimonadota bacterium]